MKFREIKPFNEGQSLTGYITQSLFYDLKNLVDGLFRIDLEENMESFTYEGTISAGTEAEIRNPLSNTPGGRLVVKHTGDPGIVDGDTEWTNNFVYLKNVGSSAATVKVIYFK